MFEEEEESSEGEEGNIVDIVMPANPKPTKEEALAKFNRSLRNWNTNVTRIKNRGAAVKTSTIDDMRAKRDDLELKADEVYELLEDGDDTFAQLDNNLTQIGNDMDSLYDIQEREEAPGSEETAVTDPDLVIEKDVKKMASNLEHFVTSLDKIRKDVNDLSLAVPAPTEKSVAEMKDFLKSSENTYKRAEDSFLQILAETSAFQSAEKLRENKEKYDNTWKQTQTKIKSMKEVINSYIDKFKPVASASVSSSTPGLERLPLPKYDGNKLGYARFKLDFERHVTYETEERRVLALKERCLTQREDRDRVANQDSLEDCWKVLDAEHGDTETTVCDVFKQWRALKSPSTDKQMRDFVSKIENGVACLNALKCAKELTASAVVSIEEKLPKKMQDEISDLIVQKKPEQTRMEIVMNFLRVKKSAAQLRISNYTPKETPKNEDQEQIKTHNTSSRGGGWGRGGGRGGRGGRGSYQGRDGRHKRSGVDTACLLCGDQHALNKCPKWQDKSNDKMFLLGFCHANMPICTYCLRRGHKVHNCRAKEDDLGCPCGSDYNQFICCVKEECVKRSNWTESSSNNNAISEAEKSETSDEDEVTSNCAKVKVNGTKVGQAVLPIQSVPISESKEPITVMFDNCSQNSFLLNDVARNLGLVGINISFVLICTNGSKTKMTSKLYRLTLVDRRGDNHNIEAIGLDNLSSKYPGFKIINLKKVLDSAPWGHAITEEKLSRNSGNIQLLLGNDVASLHPRDIMNEGELVIMQSLFGSGYTVRGHNSSHVMFTANFRGSRVGVSAVEEQTETGCHHIGSCKINGNTFEENLKKSDDLMKLNSTPTEEEINHWKVFISCVAMAACSLYMAETNVISALMKNGTEVIQDLDKEKIEQFTANRDTNFWSSHLPDNQGLVEMKEQLKVIAKHEDTTFSEPDCVLSQVRNDLVNSDPLQLGPNQAIEKFWDNSSSYYHGLVKYSKWKQKGRNAEVGDLVLIPDKVLGKCQFSRGIIESVKLDPDNIVRKVIVKYKVRNNKGNSDSDFKPFERNFKYAERNVRGFAILVTVQERSETEKVNLDEALAINSNDDEEDDSVNEKIEGTEVAIENKEVESKGSEIKENEVEENNESDKKDEESKKKDSEEVKKRIRNSDDEKEIEKSKKMKENRTKENPMKNIENPLFFIPVGSV